MAVFVLTDASVTINTVDLSSYVTNVTFTYEVDQVEVTAMKNGTVGHIYTGGMQNLSVAIEMNQDLAAGKVFDTLWSAVGSGSNTLVLKSLSTGSPNPTLTVSNSFLPSAPMIQGAVGDLAKTSVTFVGGTVVKS
jgi:hypothetical protein